jgi:hypothetical protein
MSQYKYSMYSNDINKNTCAVAATTGLEAQRTATATTAASHDVSNTTSNDASQLVRWLRQQRQEKLIAAMRRERLARMALAVDNVLFYVVSILTAVLTIVCMSMLIAYYFKREQGKPIVGLT